VYANSPVAAIWPLSVSYHGKADGVAIHDFVADSLAPTSTWSDGAGNSSANYFRYENNLYVSIHTGRFGGAENTNIQIQRWAGQNRFYSHSYERIFNSYTGETYFYSFDDECCAQTWDYSGQHWTMNQSFAADLAIDDAVGKRFVVHETLALASDGAYEQPPYESCSSFEWWGGSSYQCQSGFSRYSRTGGYTSGHSGP
jgi:hypothetical protein